MTTSGRRKEILSKLKELISIDPYEASTDRLIALVKCFARKDRERLLVVTKSAFRHTEWLKPEEVRVALAKILVALFPESWRFIKRLLSETANRYSYEVHFSLFCFLDYIQDIVNTPEVRAEILEVIQGYLNNTPKNTAMAAWMAGDLLGDHWPIKEALPILMKVATEGRFVAGREGALHGLDHICPRVKGANLQSVANTLVEISKKNRSYKIRRQAQLLLTRRELRGLVLS